MASVAYWVIRIISLPHFVDFWLDFEMTVSEGGMNPGRKKPDVSRRTWSLSSSSIIRNRENFEGFRNTPFEQGKKRCLKAKNVKSCDYEDHQLTISLNSSQLVRVWCDQRLFSTSILRRFE
jgi:hypothetical protein